MRRGSSPLTRGKPPDTAVRVSRERLIPAHAGKTKSWGRGPCPRPAHPRSRGENQSSSGSRIRPWGSSPLTRGKHRRTIRARGGCGLIPAHAGKTSRTRAPTTSTTAHPRSRGENAAAVAARAGEGGSSPLTRGKHFLTCAFIAQIGQILESLELCASSESYSLRDAYATDVL